MCACACGASVCEVEVLAEPLIHLASRRTCHPPPPLLCLQVKQQITAQLPWSSVAALLEDPDQQVRVSRGP